MVKIYKPRVILTDVDGVLLNWLGGFTEFMNDKGHIHQANTNHEYSMVNRFSLNDINSEKAFIKEFHNSGFIKDLKPLQDSIEYLTKLNINHGFKFICVTSVGNEPQLKIHRLNNLNKYFGNIFNEVHCLSMGSPKHSTLENWKDSGLFWIEDHVGNALSGNTLGLNSVLFTHPVNSFYNGNDLSRVDSWKEIYELICKDYGLEI